MCVSQLSAIITSVCSPQYLIWPADNLGVGLDKGTSNTMVQCSQNSIQCLTHPVWMYTKHSKCKCRYYQELMTYTLSVHRTLLLIVMYSVRAVSYTHLTLPTILRV